MAMKLPKSSQAQIAKLRLGELTYFRNILWQVPLLERVARLALPTRDRHRSVHGRRVTCDNFWRNEKQLHHAIAAILTQGWNGSADQVARSIDWEGVTAQFL